MAEKNAGQVTLEEEVVRKPLTEALDLAREVIGDAAATAALQEAMKLKVRDEAYLQLMIARGRVDERQVVERFRTRINYILEKKRRRDEQTESLIAALSAIINRLH